MIHGVTCAHCMTRDECIEDPERGIPCRSYVEDWDAIEADPATRKQGKAEKKRRRKAIIQEIERLNGSCKNKNKPGEAAKAAPPANTPAKN